MLTTSLVDIISKLFRKLTFQVPKPREKKKNLRTISSSPLSVSSPLHLSSSLQSLASSSQVQIRPPRAKLTTEVLSQISFPIFLGQNPKSKPMNFLPLFASSDRDEFVGFAVYVRRWVPIGMSLLGLSLKFMIWMRWWCICWFGFPRFRSVCLLDLVLQAPISLFVGFGFGFPSEMFM